MKHIIKKLVSFAKEKKKTKKKVEEEEPEEVSEDETKETEEKPVVDVKTLLQGAMEEMESRTMLLQGEVNEEKAGEILSGFLALADLKPPKQDLKEGEMPYDPITLYISTYGGSADEMFGLFDIMNNCKKSCVIETVGVGCRPEPCSWQQEQKDTERLQRIAGLCCTKYQPVHSVHYLT
jgi:hypothetical protein